MSDVTTDQTADQTVDPNAAISRGVGLALDAIEPDSPAGRAIEDFKDLVARHKAVEEQAEALKTERNQAIYRLKSEHNVGFSAMAEVLGATSSLVLYLYERAQGKTAKQIREESVASRLAKEATRGEPDPNKRQARRQTPEEKAFRKQQREALRAFIEEQRAARGEEPGGEDLSPDEADEDE